MKINETKPITEVARVTSPEPQATPPKDRVTVSGARDVSASVKTAKSSLVAGRPGRLQALEARVRAGEFHPDPARVADEILQDAETDAHLRSLLIR